MSPKSNCWHSLQGKILKIADNIAKSIKRKPFASVSVFSALSGLELQFYEQTLKVLLVK